MPSSFSGVNLFGSGPHRFQEGRAGYLILPNDIGGVPTTLNASFGTFELVVHVRGRLVASDESALWVLRDAIQSSLAANGPMASSSDLVDVNGRVYTGMRFVRVEWSEEVDRGRDVSVSYEARFHRFSLG
ncbi:MAG: hypothetical protein AAF235_10010 [Planctomycetota bacterium]